MAFYTVLSEIDPNTGKKYPSAGGRNNILWHGEAENAAAAKENARRKFQGYPAPISVESMKTYHTVDKEIIWE